MARASRLVRLSVGALLRAQDRTESLIAAAVQAEAERAAVELARKQRQERERRAAVIAALLLAGRNMKPGVAQAIERGRAAARADAADRLIAELTAAGVDTRSIHHMAGRPMVASAQRDRHEEDRLHAESAADSLTATWRGVALAASLAAMRRHKDPAQAVALSPRKLASRVELTAHTETAVAYNDEHYGALQSLVRYDGDIERQAVELRLMREWSAMVDACEHCWPLDGVRVGLSESFPGGSVPGSMHPRCRCIEVLVTQALEERQAA